MKTLYNEVAASEYNRMEMLSCLRKYNKNTDTSGYRTEKLPALLSEV